MSRLGKRPIKLPNGVKLSWKPGNIFVEGPKGKLTRNIPESIKVELKDSEAVLQRTEESKQARADHGLVWSLLNAMVKGVSEGFEKRLQSVGVGYRMSVQGQKLTLNVGYSHPVIFDLPQGVAAKVSDQTKLSLMGIDKEQIGALADKIRGVRPPEPYKGKGIRYEGERIQMKEGKSAAGGGK
ncbi:MAG: 50S ribosomal protein L6 [Bradymonadales bacterium]|nr:MAG: 50S ribosomal protein L6 [Bradymonadales bacterium]